MHAHRRNNSKRSGFNRFREIFWHLPILFEDRLKIVKLKKRGQGGVANGCKDGGDDGRR